MIAPGWLVAHERGKRLGGHRLRRQFRQRSEQRGCAAEQQALAGAGCLQHGIGEPLVVGCGFTIDHADGVVVQCGKPGVCLAATQIGQRQACYIDSAVTRPAVFSAT